MAEIAEELRVNPATVRLWVSKGTLPAQRAGQRKLLIRRSALDRMLRVTTVQRPAAQLSMGQLSTSELKGYRAALGDMQRLLGELQLLVAEHEQRDRR